MKTNLVDLKLTLILCLSLTGLTHTALADDTVPKLKVNQNDYSFIPKGSGDADGIITVLMVDSKELAKTLPKELSLDGALIGIDGKYPAAMYIGGHKNLTTDSWIGPVQVAKKYNELTLSFTVVGPNSPNERYNYTSAILVDSLPSQKMGQLLGYPKRFVYIMSDGQNISAHSWTTGDTYVIANSWDVEKYDLKSFNDNLEILKMNMRPTIGFSKELGYVCFDFDWNFPKASVKPMNLSVIFGEKFAGKGLAGILHVPSSLDKQPFGTFHIQTHWEMKNYRACK
ncbi:MAG: hypothetical protein V4692_00940 [Bdellovibrionota bacterium]